MATRTLLIVEAANPDWTSVPLVGWSLASAIARIKPCHLVTHVRNRAAILKTGLIEGQDFTVIDSEAVARPLWRASSFLRGRRGGGWTTNAAFTTVAYYYFESLVWKRFGRAIENGLFDLVHRITPLSPATPSILAKRCHRVGVPFVIGPLNGGVPWPKGFNSARHKEREWLSYVRSAYKLMPAYKSTLRSAAALIVGSKITLQQIPLAYQHKCIYLPENAIDPSKFSVPVKQNFSACLRACFVGRLVPLKGTDMLLEAVLPLLRSSRLHLDIIGDGPLMSELQKFVRQERVECQVMIHGQVDHDTVPRLMCQSQLLIFPSIREFGGGVVLEAMALGLVPVVIDYGGPSELVTDETGLKVALGPRSDIIAGLRRTIEAISDQPEQIAAMSQNARNRVSKHFTWDAKARQIVQIYDWILGRRSERPTFFDDHTGSMDDARDSLKAPTTN